MVDTIRTYRDFWPFYLEEHSKPATRTIHFVGTALVFVALAAAIATRNGWLLLAMPVAGYGFAWFAHFFVEHNRPATFTYPLWSLFSDFRMFFVWLAGGLGGELRKHNIVARA
ncbi:MAG: DUF962 domain-containing protein [Rhodospirillaceae bacterium]|nr:DUF962 domain-containing protein [Rhodospirillaceae bacterium]